MSVKNQVSVFPCQRWLSTKEDNGQIERTLVPVDKVSELATTFFMIVVRYAEACDDLAATFFAT